jgi:hypothetical protein
MQKTKLLFAVLVAAAVVACITTASAAPAVHFLAAGSSAMYQGFGVATINKVASGSGTCGGAAGVGVACGIHHYTFKSTSPGVAATQLKDPRPAPPEYEP